MDRRIRIVFLALIVAQAAHSIEEYTFALYDVLPMARFASVLVSADLATGFAVLNTAIVAFGVWCSAIPIRSGWASARALAWVWVVVELGNGVGHPALALRAGSYFPGVGTAPFLLVLAIALATLLRRTGEPVRRSGSGASSSPPRGNTATPFHAVEDSSFHAVEDSPRR